MLLGTQIKNAAMDVLDSFVIHSHAIPIVRAYRPDAISLDISGTFILMLDPNAKVISYQINMNVNRADAIVVPTEPM